MDGNICPPEDRCGGKKPVETLELVEELRGEGILELWVWGTWSVMYSIGLSEPSTSWGIR